MNNRLHIIEKGSGSLTLLFLHGLAGDLSQMTSLADQFHSQYRVVLVDLRGHGRTGRISDEYEISHFSEDLINLAHHLDLHQTVIIGHSLGGLIGVDLAARNPKFLKGIVALDPPLLFPEPIKVLLKPLKDKFGTSLHSDAILEFLNQYLFIPEDDMELKARITERFLSFSPSAFSTIWGKIYDYDALPAFRTNQIPTLIVRGHSPSDLRQLQAEFSHIWVGQTVGTGHYHHLEVPEQVIPMLKRFLIRKCVS